jgi:nucleoside 2-deoxyribosyltransferase
MKVFLGAKFTGMNNKEKLEKIRAIIKELGHEIFIGPIDTDVSGKEKIPPKEFMQKVFGQIKKSDIVLFEHEKVSTGMGIEAGYAKSLGKRIIVLYPKKAEWSDSIKGIADLVIEYDTFDDLKKKLSIIK